MNKNTKFITGLKALGAIMIVISHLKMQFSGFTDLTWKFFTFSAYFIVLFVCISAFTIALSIERRKEFNLFSYMKRRWFRLAPSYYFILGIGLLMKTAVEGWHYFWNTIPNIPYLLLFLNLDPINVHSQASILGVEWMLPILFWFYLAIPLLVFSVRKLFPLYLILFAGSIYLHFNPTLFTTYTGFGGFGWSMQFYVVMYTYTIFIYFLYTTDFSTLWGKNIFLKVINGIGIGLCFLFMLYYMNTTSEKIYMIGLMLLTGYLLWIKQMVMRYIRKFSKILSACIDNIDSMVLGIVLVKYMINLYFIKDPHIVLTIWFVALLIAGTHRPFLMRILFENRWMQWLGVISFGMYLLHPLAIIVAEKTIPMQYPLLRVTFIFPLTIATAFLLYKVIENPVKKFSK